MASFLSRAASSTHTQISKASLGTLLLDQLGQVPLSLPQILKPVLQVGAPDVLHHLAAAVRLKPLVAQGALDGVDALDGAGCVVRWVVHHVGLVLWLGHGSGYVVGDTLTEGRRVTPGPAGARPPPREERLPGTLFRCGGAMLTGSAGTGQYETQQGPGESRGFVVFGRG